MVLEGEMVGFIWGYLRGVFFFFSLVGDWLERMGMILVFLCKIETFYILYREEKLVVREEER